MEPPSVERTERTAKGARVAIYFAEEDRHFAEVLVRHLATLRAEGLVDGWTEHTSAAGGWRDGEGASARDLVIFLVTADFFADDACQNPIDRARGKDMVMTVLARPTNLDGTGLERTTILPRNGRGIMSWRHPEDAWEDVLAGLRERLTASAHEVRRKAQWSGRVTRMTLDHFTVFEHAVIQASPGLNVLVGRNSTGKSHALKAMYALLRAPLVPSESGSFEGKLGAVFRLASPTSLERLPGVKGERASLDLECENGRARIRLAGPGEPTEKTTDFSGSRALFLPSREALSMYEGFTSAYERRELSFDETYYDLCKELSALPLREKSIGPLRPILAALEAALGGSVSLSGTRFVVRSPIGDVEAHMVAEGMRKIASVAYLIRNGALTDQTILFWDEPEANLNPKLVTVVANVLRQLASLGVQVFLATHDYLLARELSLASEYHTAPDVEVRFFSFHRENEVDPVQIEGSATFTGLSHNPILEEYAAHYEREQALFYSPEQPNKERT